MTDALDLIFTPVEAEALTGVSNALQRDWRRRGYLPGKEGSRVAYSLEALSRLFLLKLFERYSTPAKSMEVIEHLTPRFADVLRSVVDGRQSGDDGAAVVWADGEITYHAALGDAFPNAEREAKGPAVVLSVSGLGVPIGIRVRDFVTAGRVQAPQG